MRTPKSYPAISTYSDFSVDCNKNCETNLSYWNLERLLRCLQAQAHLDFFIKKKKKNHQ